MSLVQKDTTGAVLRTCCCNVRASPTWARGRPTGVVQWVQECVGRLGSFPHGIQVLTAADYFTVSTRSTVSILLPGKMLSPWPKPRL